MGPDVVGTWGRNLMSTIWVGGAEMWKAGGLFKGLWKLYWGNTILGARSEGGGGVGAAGRV